MADPVSRRRFLKVLGTTGAGGAALAGCGGEPAEKLIPLLASNDVPLEDQVPGIPTWYATTCRDCSAGCGLHVKVREGRAIKIEGNPDHPVNRGRTCARAQASLQSLYNPDRVRGPLQRTATGEFEPISWDDAIARLTTALRGATGNQVRFITGHETGSFDSLITTFLEALGSGGRLTFEPLGHDALRQATRDVFGVDALPLHDFSAARYVLSFGADFLETYLSPVEYSRTFTEGHAFRDGGMGRLVHVEPRMSLTAMNADEWIAPVPGSEGALALAIAGVIVRERLGRTPAGASALRRLLDAHMPGAVVSRTGVPIETIERLAREFAAAPSIALAGGIGAQHANAAFTAAAVHILNYVTGNIGRTVTFDSQATLPASGQAQLLPLVADMKAQRVQVLMIHGANPAYASPAAAQFADGMGSVPFKVSFSRVMDETTRLADLVLPDHEPLEQWNDSAPRSGVFALQQPVMQPVFDTRQTGDVLLAVAGQLGGNAARRLSAESYEAHLKDAWRRIQRSVGDTRPFDVFWNDALGAGGVYRPSRARNVSLAASAARIQEPGMPAADGKLTLIAYPSSVLYDGRTANRPWLQELPDPVSKVTWSSWVEIHPDTARQMGIAAGDHITVTSDAGSVTVPAYVYEGIRPDVVAIPLGQGHTSYGRYATGVGANAYHLLAPGTASFGGVNHYAGVTLHPTGVHERLATTEGSPRQMDRGLAQSVTLASLAAGHIEEHAAHAAEVPENVEHLLEEVQQEHYRDYLSRPPYSGDHPRWAMAIDLSRCTGCSACVTACYAENNIPHVGKGQVQRGREMSWLRIERYLEGGGDEPLRADVLPMLCQQCGNAPCEPVCPVFAAYHTPDGLNGQVYNRCVGTRYCSNNCPYKVRYFNWYDFSEPEVEFYAWPEPMHLLLNPDVTVRSKGVMEKCTFCVQRIRGAQHHARMSGEPIQDGELQTACQQVCPANAIVFGDLNDASSRVAQLSRDDRGYHVLGSLNTRPGITYLRRVRNVTDA